MIHFISLVVQNRQLLIIGPIENSHLFSFVIVARCTTGYYRFTTYQDACEYHPLILGNAAQQIMRREMHHWASPSCEGLTS